MNGSLSVASRPAATIHSLGHAQVVLRQTARLQTSGSVSLLSPQGAGATLGIGWFQAIRRAIRADFPQADILWILDCGHAAGRAATALGAGFDAVIFTGSASARPALASLAEASSCLLLDTRPDSFDLGTWERGGTFKPAPSSPGDNLGEDDRMQAALADWFRMRHG